MRMSVFIANFVCNLIYEDGKTAATIFAISGRLSADVSEAHPSRIEPAIFSALY